MKLFRLINPSDPYTFYAPSIEVAGLAVCMLSPQYGAAQVGGENPEQTPIMFGWDLWLQDRGINQQWIGEHQLEVAAALESVLIGDPGERRDLDELQKRMTAEEWTEYIAERHDRLRTSMNDIGGFAHALAARLRAADAAEAAAEQETAEA